MSGSATPCRLRPLLITAFCVGVYAAVAAERQPCLAASEICTLEALGDPRPPTDGTYPRFNMALSELLGDLTLGLAKPEEARIARRELRDGLFLLPKSLSDLHSVLRALWLLDFYSLTDRDARVEMVEKGLSHNSIGPRSLALLAAQSLPSGTARSVLAHARQLNVRAWFDAEISEAEGLVAFRRNLEELDDEALVEAAKSRVADWRQGSTDGPDNSEVQDRKLIATLRLLAERDTELTVSYLEHLWAGTPEERRAINVRVFSHPPRDMRRAAQAELLHSGRLSPGDPRLLGPIARNY